MTNHKSLTAQSIA